MFVKFYVYSNHKDSCILDCLPSKGDVVEFDDDPNVYTVCKIKWNIKEVGEHHVQIYLEY